MANPTSGTRTGGGRYMDFFTVDDEGNLGSDPVFTLDRIISPQIAKAADGTRAMTITQDTDDAALEAFLKTYAPVPESGSSQEVKYNDGYKEGGTTGTGANLVGVLYGATNNLSGDNDRKVHVMSGRVSPESGSTTESADTRTQPSFVFNSTKIAAAVSVDSSRIRTDLITTSGFTSMVLETNAQYQAFYRNKA